MRATGLPKPSLTQPSRGLSLPRGRPSTAPFKRCSCSARAPGPRRKSEPLAGAALQPLASGTCESTCAPRGARVTLSNTSSARAGQKTSVRSWVKPRYERAMPRSVRTRGSMVAIATFSDLPRPPTRNEAQTSSMPAPPTETVAWAAAERSNSRTALRS